MAFKKKDSRYTLLFAQYFLYWDLVLFFVLLSILFTNAAFLFHRARNAIPIISGIIIIFFGLNIIFGFTRIFNREIRIPIKDKPQIAAGAILVGMAFAAGWTPCIGPILTSILLLAGNTGEIGKASLLLTAYSAGLGIPFIIAAAALNHTKAALQKIKPYVSLIRYASGILLVIVGVLILLGRLQNLNAFLSQISFSLNNWAESNPTHARIVPSILLMILAFIYPLLYVCKKAHHMKPVLMLLSLLFGIAAILHSTGIFPLIPALAAWLQYQGI